MQNQTIELWLAICTGLVLCVFVAPLGAQDSLETDKVKQPSDRAPVTYGGEIRPGGYRTLTATKIFGEGKATALVQAIWHLDAEVARQVIESGVDIDTRGRYGLTPLLFLVEHEKIEAAQLALSLGADPNLASDGGDTPLYYAMDRDRWEDLLKMLIRAGADVRKASELARFHTGYPIEHRVLQRLALHIIYLGPGKNGHASKADKRGDVEPLWWILERGGNVNAQDYHGRTLLSRAYLARDFDVADGLLERGANPHINRSRGSMPFEEALSQIPMRPFTVEEARWMEKVRRRVDDLRGNQELIREAREIDAAFAIFRERFNSTRQGMADKKMTREMDAIIEAIKELAGNKESSD